MGRPSHLHYAALAAANLLLFAGAELATRVYFATQAGPPLLLYGTERYRAHVRQVFERDREAYDRAHPESVGVHRNHVGAYRGYAPDQADSYSKFLPNQLKRLRSAVSGEMTTARINNHGFRGRNFAAQKPPGTVRVVTLGASSTFGYASADHETYPALLEQHLR